MVVGAAQRNSEDTNLQESLNAMQFEEPAHSRSATSELLQWAAVLPDASQYEFVAVAVVQAMQLMESAQFVITYAFIKEIKMDKMAILLRYCC